VHEQPQADDTARTPPADSSSDAGGEGAPPLEHGTIEGPGGYAEEPALDPSSLETLPVFAPAPSVPAAGPRVRSPAELARLFPPSLEREGGYAQLLPSAAAAPVDGKRRLRRREWILLTLILLLLLAAVGLGTLALVNGRRADDWQQRADVLAADVTELNAIVEKRTDDLNEQIGQLNATATKLKQTQNALARSESDVSDLSTRQTELANEKAQLEDQQTALEGVSSAMNDCTAQLYDLVSWLVNEDYYSIQTYVDGIASTCESAQWALQSYQSVYP
jgi:hypothetical protein